MDDEHYSKKIKIKDIKVILLGDTGVGKTCIINRYINNKFDSNIENTVCSSFSTKEVIKNNILYRLNLWDTIGQEKYNSITNIFIKGSNIVILVYSVDSLSSLQDLDLWYNSVNNALQENSYILAIVGNKADLIIEEEAVVSEEEGRKYAKKMNAEFKLVSCKEDFEGVNNFFDMLLEKIISLNYIQVSESYIINRSTYKDMEKKKKINKKCC